MPVPTTNLDVPAGLVIDAARAEAKGDRAGFRACKVRAFREAGRCIGRAVAVALGDSEPTTGVRVS